MENRDNNILNSFARFDRHPLVYTYALIACYLFANNSINASSVWMEHTRDGLANIQLWEPYVWEFSSALAVMIILPFVFALFKRVPLTFNQIGRQVLIHILATLVFSALHVGLMVAMREAVYWYMGSSYEFAPWLREFWYEYRKDAWGYLFWLVNYHVALALYRRLKGEASLVVQTNTSEKTDNNLDKSIGNYSKSETPEFLLVKKLDKEFLVKVSEIEWLESAGNYVNLHKSGRIYPLRGTLSETVARLAPAGFSRIHRSYGVNLHCIDCIQYQNSGDGEVTLSSGTTLGISRRYKEQFKNAFN